MAQTLALSMGVSCGPSCTSPGLIVVQHSALAIAFIDALASEVERLRPHAMLNPGIRGAYAAAAAKRAQDGRLPDIDLHTWALRGQPFGWRA